MYLKDRLPIYELHGVAWEKGYKDGTMLVKLVRTDRHDMDVAEPIN